MEDQEITEQAITKANQPDNTHSKRHKSDHNDENDSENLGNDL